MCLAAGEVQRKQTTLSKFRGQTFNLETCHP